METEVLLSHLEGLAKKHFRLDALRPQQKEVFAALQSHGQVLAMLPTGSGKTLLYALGSLLFSERLTIVICPLIALMREQCQRMLDAGIETAAIYSEQSDDERRNVYRQVASGRTKLLFVSPERFCLLSFQRFLKKLRIGMIVVDEAHCVVTWGHSFRPEYSQLAQLLRQIEPTRILALTATATVASRVLIREMVFPEPKAVFEVIDRPIKNNIQLESIRVFSEDERWLSIVRLLREQQAQQTILYFNRREQCQEAAQRLKKSGYNAIVYHAGLQREQRRSVEDYLRQSERPVIICATLAFGMGIDLPNVKLVVVVGFPGNIEEMFQMMGRAGRRGESAKAYIVWSGSDPKKRLFQFEKMMASSHEMVDRFNAISGFFPGKNQSALIQRHQLAKVLTPFAKSASDSDAVAKNVIAAMSMLGHGLNLESARSDWIEIRISKPEYVAKWLADLPSGISRRRLVLEWLNSKISIESKFKGSLRFSTAVSELSDEIQISQAGVMEVLRYFAEQDGFSFSLIAQSEVVQSVLVRGGLQDLLRELPRYQKWRSALNLSLQALTHFVMAKDCRMSEAEDLFLHRSGAKSDGSHCGHCDLCLSKERASMRGNETPFAKGLTLNHREHLL